MFCNVKYGLPFIHMAIVYSKVHKVNLTLVFSDKRYRPEGNMKKFVYHAKVIISRIVKKILLRYKYRFPTIIVDDVNSARFRRIIMPDSHGIIAGFNQIFQEETIGRFDTLVNFHPSILPLYRGPVPSYWCIANGERVTGYTLHEVSEDIDAGEILFQEEVLIDLGMDELSLDNKIATMASKTLGKYLEYIEYKERWSKKIVDAKEVYKKHISYMSFPKI